MTIVLDFVWRRDMGWSRGDVAAPWSVVPDLDSSKEVLLAMYWKPRADRPAAAVKPNEGWDD